MTALLVLSLAWLPGISPAEFSATPASSTSITASDSASSTQGLFDSLRDWFVIEDTNQALLTPDESSIVSVWDRDADTLLAMLTAAEGYYLYRDRIAFDLQESSGAAIKIFVLPEGKGKDDLT